MLHKGFRCYPEQANRATLREATHASGRDNYRGSQLLPVPRNFSRVPLSPGQHLQRMDVALLGPPSPGPPTVPDPLLRLLPASEAALLDVEG